MDERAAASRLRANAKRRLTVELNVTEALIVDGQTERVQKEQIAGLKEAFIDTCNRYAETFTEDELTEEVCDRLAAYSSEQLQFYVRVMSTFSTPNVKQDVAPEESNNLQKLLTLMSLPKIQLEPFGGDSVDYYNFMAEFDKLVDEVSDDAQVKLNILKRSCVGYAANVISDCGQLDAEQGCTRTRKLLAEKCGDPHRASQQIQRELRDGKTVRSTKELDALYISLRKGIDCLKHIDMLAELNSQITIKDIISRVQFRKVSDGWRKQALRILDERNSYPDIEDLRRFLDKEVRDLSDPVYGIADVKSGTSSSRTHTSLNTLTTETPRGDVSTRFSGKFTTVQPGRVASPRATQSADASTRPGDARARSVPLTECISGKVSLLWKYQS